jgi:hypothetical protein
MKYIVNTSQEFAVTYEVEADSPEKAWTTLIERPDMVTCQDQSPEGIIGTFEDSDIFEAQ